MEYHGPLPGSNYTVGRAGNAIDRIVLHTMVGWISAADARFHNAGEQVSAHYGVRLDGSVWQWVNEADTAYHAGLYGVNQVSVGIEHEDGGNYGGTRPDSLYEASAALVAEIAHKYAVPLIRGTGGPGIYDHRQVVGTACPDALDTDRIIREANALAGITREEFEALKADVAATLNAMKAVYDPLVHHKHDTSEPK